METPKITLLVELGTTPIESVAQCQKIKNAMAQAILSKINTAGIIDASDEQFEVWESIYLSADFKLFELTHSTVAAPAIAG